MWKIGDVKRSAKSALKSNYWISFFVIFTLGILCTGLGLGAGGFLTFKVNDSVFVRSFVLPAIYYMDTVQFIIFLAAILTLLVISIVLVILLCAYFTCPIEVGAAKYFIEANKGNAVAGNLLSSFRKGAYKSIVRAKFNKEVNLALWVLFACIPSVALSVLSFFIFISQDIFNIAVLVGTIIFAIPCIVKTYQWRLVEYIAAEGLVQKAKEARKLSKKLMKGNCWKAFFLDLSYIGWFILSVITLGIVGLFWTAPYKAHANAALYSAINKKDEVEKEEPVKKAELSKVATPAVVAPVAKPVEKKVEPKKAPAKKASAKKPATKKTTAKKATPAKKAEPKKVPAKKTEPVKKAEPAKVVTPAVVAPVAKPVEKKVEPKKAPVKKAEPKKVEPKKAPVKKVGPKTAPAKKVEPKKPVAEKTSNK